MRNKQLLTSWVFWMGVLVLFFNDFFLKPTFANALTGKLSDLTGLFILPIFLSVFFPKNIWVNCLLSGAIFLIWNSSLVQPFLDGGTAMGVPFHRTIDPSDNWALMVLPISYAYIQREPKQKPRFRLPNWGYYTLGFLCMIPLLATTFAPNFEAEVNKKYVIHKTQPELLADIRQLNADLSVEADSLFTLTRLVIDGDSILRTAKFTLDNHKKGTVLRLHFISTYRNFPTLFAPGSKRRIKREAKKYFIEEIR